MAITDENLWHGEERLWLEGSSAYGELVDDDCLMLFGETGILDRDRAMISLMSGPRWTAVDMQERHVTRPGREAVVLAYRAEAQRDGGDPYRAYCSSTYRGGDEGWKLIQHQQTVIN
ncbi:DUF4440 domain-containing protein [Sphingomonas sabuli]|uniref:DUF4440 domain-containing protein n=1 Tax=Sphingomonas sabuli TaxID=2764186 RepID=A0A7G9L4L8_9SPHN|nr:DUF4440 domain-containing protein [Sphingomonas sabuli]QNM83567.1 DUF4440 domain-containing protein [Sphingomonas sabuli]